MEKGCSLKISFSTDPERLQKQFQDILRHGIAFDNEEHDIGTKAIGTPIFNNEGRPVAALVVVGPAQRIKLKSDSSLAKQLRKTAAKISKKLYYKSPQPWEQ